MSSISREKLLALLQSTIESKLGEAVDISRMVSGVVIKDDEVGFVLNVNPKEAEKMESVRQACETAVKALPEVSKVTAVMTAESAPQPAAAKPDPSKAQWNKESVAGVKRIIAVASGKGGVGKSTTTICLAKALQALGLKVGVLDADIYGPSQPRMFGLKGQPEIAENKMVPLDADGIKVMSAGFLMEDEAAILRGPMITKALHQMLRGSLWASDGAMLDVLLIDLPPGTGDVQLSLAQQAPIDGAVVVTTPQQVAVADARKAVQMFRKVNIKIFGVIENMSYLQPTPDAEKIYPFGQGGGEALAKEMATLFLGAVPLEMPLGAAVDKGESFQNLAVFSEIGGALAKQLDILQDAA